MSGEIKGLIWNIQRYNIHDGSGIRTLVFFKGCSLRCIWCSNPEGQQMEPEMMEGETIGTIMTVDEVIRVAQRDEAFFRRSGGGITLSGGEPLLQAAFAAKLLKAAKENYLNTAIETCGHVDWDQFEKVIPYTDTFLFDIKNMDPFGHQRQTGQSNELILENLRKLATLRANELVFRTPIIPGQNDSRDNLMSIAELAKHLNIMRWDLIPYHRYGEEKYKALGRAYPLEGLREPSEVKMEQIVSEIKLLFPWVYINH